MLPNFSRQNPELFCAQEKLSICRLKVGSTFVTRHPLGLLAISAAMNRITARFAELKKQNQKGFVVYIGAGDPNLKATHDLALAFDHAGVDILELGVPFSDPLADGLVNQLAAQRGLASGTT
ncbi:MAG: tryptophan synthase subunit alpha, partial [Verrucomicrobiota bacterium]